VVQFNQLQGAIMWPKPAQVGHILLPGAIEYLFQLHIHC